MEALAATGGSTGDGGSHMLHRVDAGAAKVGRPSCKRWLSMLQSPTVLLPAAGVFSATISKRPPDGGAAGNLRTVLQAANGGVV
jgi:hypothetical protein